jgi:hypothetical protein
VATSVATEGTPLRADEHLLVADSPSAFADHVRRLLDDDLRWSELAEQGRVVAEQTYGVSAVRAQVARLVDRAVRTRRPSPTR